ncbi:hypothetical protein MTO96_048138 [Rhipicephalus appendiculatus]
MSPCLELRRTEIHADLSGIKNSNTFKNEGSQIFRTDVDIFRWSVRFRPSAPSAAVTCTERGQNPDTQLFPQTQGQQVSNGEGMLMQCLDTADNDRPHQAEPVDLADRECDRHKKVPAACTSSALPCPPLTRQDVGCETDPAPTVLASSNLVDRAVGPNTRACYFGGYDTISSTAGAIRNLCGVDDNVFSLLLSLLPHVGLVISPFQPWLCASPDGLFETSSGVTLLEIKCPYSRDTLQQQLRLSVSTLLLKAFRRFRRLLDDSAEIQFAVGRRSPRFRWSYTPDRFSFSTPATPPD